MITFSFDISRLQKHVFGNWQVVNMHFGIAGDGELDLGCLKCGHTRSMPVPNVFDSEQLIRKIFQEKCYHCDAPVEVEIDFCP